MSWSTYLGFGADISWFGHLAAQIQKHSRFFQGYTTLAACSPKDGPSPLVICAQQHIYADRNAHRAAAIESVDYTTIAHSLTATVLPPCDKISLFTQLNWIPSPNFGPDDTAGALGVTRLGPYWQITPQRSLTQQFDPSLLVY